MARKIQTLFIDDLAAARPRARPGSPSTALTTKSTSAPDTATSCAPR
jgi:hypothetical protein